MLGRQSIELKTRAQVAQMHAAGLVVADALEAARRAAVPGATTRDLDVAAAATIAQAGASPSFLGYQGFPATVCVSVGDEVVHGIPGDRVLRDGDLVSIDCGAVIEGWHGDSALSCVVGKGTAADQQLVAVTREAMWAGVAALGDVRRVGDVGAAVQASVEVARVADGRCYGIVEDYVGHGIGRQMHQAPDVPNIRSRRRGPRIVPGMCLAVEPMVTAGSCEVEELDDGWTAVTVDRSRAAHWEHSVAILPDGIFVLTARDGGAGELARFGIVPVTL